MADAVDRFEVGEDSILPLRQAKQIGRLMRDRLQTVFPSIEPADLRLI